MTEKQVADQVGKWMKLFQLQQWEIGLDLKKGSSVEANGEGQVIAFIEPDRCSQSAVITMAMDNDDEELKNTICHEMIHLLFFEVETLLYALVGFISDEQIREVMGELVHGRKEEFVIRMERALRNAIPT